MFVALLVAVVWSGTNWGSSRKAADVVTTAARVGDLVIAITEKGELESAESIQVTCEIEGGGKLVKIVPEGTQVKKGDIVVQFDTDVLLKGINEQEVKWEQAEGKVKATTSELEVQRNKADSEIAKADLALTLAKLDYESYEEGEYLVEVDKRKGTLELARKEMKEAEDNLEFTRGMVKKGFAQLEQIRVIELTVEGKRYAVRQQEADLRVFEKFTKVRKITELKAKAEEAKRDLERTKKSQAAATEKSVNELAAAQKTAGLEKRQLERLQAQLDKCEVKAPQDGIVIYYKRPWDESSRIRPGVPVVFQQPIFTLPDLGRMKVKVKIHESVIKKVHLGLTATMRVDAHANQVLNGKVIRVATLAQSEDWRGGGVKEYETGVSIDDLPAEAGLRPGMSAEVRILVKKIPDALVVPVQAVTEVGGRHVCYVVSGTEIEQREVKIGEGNEQLVQILGGISENDKVALDARTRAAAELDKGKPTEAPKKEPESKSSSTVVSKGL
jgi:HlyD family secretion protein